MENLPPSIPRWFGRTRPDLNLVEIANNLSDDDTIVAYCMQLMSHNAGVAGQQKKAKLAIEDPEGEESRTRNRSKVLSQFCSYNVPGKASKLRIKCKKCGWERDDHMPAWDNRTSKYVAQEKTCETPDCSPQIHNHKPRRKQQYFVPVDATIRCILSISIYRRPR